MVKHLPARPSLAYVPNQLLDLLHRSLASWQYTKRHKVLSRHLFNPATDMIDHYQQALRLNPRKRMLKADIYQYLVFSGDA